jgi:hypothetical protein
MVYLVTLRTGYVLLASSTPPLSRKCDSLLTCMISGYLLDLLIAQAFGLVLSPLEQEFGFNSSTLSVDESWRCAQQLIWPYHRSVRHKLCGVLPRNDLWYVFESTEIGLR